MYDYEIPNHDLDFFGHFPSKLSKTIEEYIRHFVLKNSRYLFTRREGRKQFSYCTHCKTEHESKGLRHGKSWQCPNCKSLVWVKASGRGRKTLVDDAYLIWYEKSQMNPNSIIARGLYIKRDYSDDYRKVETLIKPIAFYLFEWEKGGRMMRRPSDPYFKRWDVWSECKSVHSEATRSMSYTPCYHCISNIAEAVKDTPFQYCMWKSYEPKDYVEFFDLAARYQCIEFLTKIGLHSIVNAKLEGRETYGAINWRGKTPQKILRLSMHEIKEMKKAGHMNHRTLRYYQLSKKDGFNLNWDDASDLSDLMSSYYSDELAKLLHLAPNITIKKYLLKQLRRNQKSYYSSGSVLIAWRDYLEECEVLGMNLNAEHVLFPNDLYQSHQKNIKKIKIKKDKSLNKKIEKRLYELNQYKFEGDGLLIRPALSSTELFEEGEALIHCVGSYASKYAAGKTNLFVIRRLAEPDKPFYTVEVIDNEIIQAYGYDNELPTEEVQAFINSFKANKLTKNNRRIAV